MHKQTFQLQIQIQITLFYIELQLKKTLAQSYFQLLTKLQ